MHPLSRISPVLLLLLAPLGAQQPNSASAALVLNDAVGPGWPILGVPLFTGVDATLEFSGEPSAPVLVAQSLGVATGSATTAFGIVDLDLSTLALPFAGPLSTGPAGTESLTIPVPSSLPVGVTVALQAVLGSASAPAGAVLTAATEVTSALGVVGAPLALGDDQSVPMDFSAFGLSAKFYAYEYQSCFVNSNGAISFGTTDGGDFTPSASEFLAGPPRAASFWNDVSPNAGGSVRWEIDFRRPLPTLAIRWIEVPAGFGGAGIFTHAIELELAPSGSSQGGDVRLSHASTNPSSEYDMLTGVTPGWNLGNQIGPVDLSVGSFSGGANDAIHELFMGTASVTGNPGGPYDLAGMTLHFMAVGAGSPGASYSLL